MKFVADENIPFATVCLLRAAGHVVIAIIERDPGASDLQVLTLASTEAGVLLTFDRDFGALVRQRRGPKPRGVTLFRFVAASPEVPGRLLLDLVESGVTLTGHLTVVGRSGVRQRRLQAKSRSGCCDRRGPRSVIVAVSFGFNSMRRGGVARAAGVAKNVRRARWTWTVPSSRSAPQQQPLRLTAPAIRATMALPCPALCHEAGSYGEPGRR